VGLGVGVTVIVGVAVRVGVTVEVGVRVGVAVRVRVLVGEPKGGTMQAPTAKFWRNE
jgi:hypothetical protein